MDKAKQHWKILKELGTDLANRVREFMVIGEEGDGVIVATEDGLTFWLGQMKFGLCETKTTTKPTLLEISDLVQMAQGECHILLVNKRGEIYSMGKNKEGQLGIGIEDDEKTYFSPQLISIPQHKFISVRCGRVHSLALTEDGKVWAWGGNHSGQLGVPSSSLILPSPSQIVELDPHRVVAVECGGQHSLALTDRGEVYGWGKNGDRQLGDSDSRTFKLSPSRIPTPSPVQSIAAGDCHTLLLTQTGEVWACGRNDCGQLGLPRTTECCSSLVKVEGLPPILQIASNPAFDMSIAMTSYKRCFVWGLVDREMSISTPRKLSPDYSTVDCPFSLHRSTPHSVSIPETTPGRLSALISRIFDNRETSSDVQFVVEQRTIHAHRIILSNSSDYFARMFSERWMALVDPEDPIVRVTIPDHSYQVFYDFLRFLYTNSFEVSNEFLPEMFELANQYIVPELQQLCLLQMRSTLTPATCCLYYQLTHRLSLPELDDFQEDLVQFASTRMSEITLTAAYQSMDSNLCDNLTNAAQNFTVI